MKKILIILALILGTVSATYAVDSPHGPTNTMNCDTCHYVDASSPFWGGTYTPSDPTVSDDTVNNNLCRQCHITPKGTDYSASNNAPFAETHSQYRMTENPADKGGWHVECRVCHNPHYQRQYTYYKKTDASVINIATGTVSNITPGAATSTFTVSGVTIKAGGGGWTDPATWNKKSNDDPYRGLIFYPNTMMTSVNYEITAASIAAGSGTITVKGDVTSDLTNGYISNGNGFTVLYGMLIKEKIQVDAVPTYKTVKFMERKGSKSYAYNDNAPGNDTVIDGICQVCHTGSPNAFFKSTATGNPTYWKSDGTGANHNNNTVCSSCHSHTKGFAASCTSCHGSPPVDGTTLVDFTNPSGTGSTTAGAHSAHVKVLAQECSYCHYDSVGAGSNHQNNKVTMGFVNMYSKTGTSGGHYNGQAAVSYNSSDASTTVSSGGAKTCASIYCHGGTIGGPVTTPVWDAAAGAYSCSTAPNGACHRASASNAPPTGSHTKHAGNAGGQLNIACTKCHPATTSSHVDGSVAWQLDTADARFSTTAKYKTLATGSTGLAAPSAAYGQCSTLYCHSSGQAADGGSGGPVYQSPAPTWGGTVLCGDCHKTVLGTTLGAIDTGSHSEHMAASGVNGCGDCHVGAANNGTSYSSTSHVNALIDVTNTYNAGGTPGNGYGTCSTASCHASAYSSGTAVTPVWGTAGGGCGSCHPIAAFGAPATGSHTKHLSTTLYHMTECADCHKGATVGTSGGVEHLDTNIDVYKTSAGDLGYPVNKAKHAAGSGYSNCTTAYCHSPGQNSTGGALTPGDYASVAWGGAAACGSCHKISVASGLASGSHTKHLNSTGIGCDKCHEGATSNASAYDSTSHVNNLIDVSSTQIVSYTSAGTPGNGYGTCTTTYCHGTAAPVWGGTTNCGSCHNANSSLAGRHSKHYETATVATANNTANSSTAGSYVLGCGNCHNSAATNHATGVVSANQAAEVSFSSTGSYASGGSSAGTDRGFSYTAGTCSSTYCHGNYPGSGLNASPTWTGAAACGSCHGAGNTLATRPNSGSHERHVSNTITVKAAYTYDREYSCVLCHKNVVSGSVIGGYTVADKSKHVNALVDTSFDLTDARISVASTYSISSGTQSPSDGATRAYGSCTVYCHSDVQGANGVGAPTKYDTVHWGAPKDVSSNYNSEVNCYNGSCHATSNHSVGMTTGSHQKHITYSFGRSATESCLMCHRWEYSDNGNLSCSICHGSTGEKVAHMNGLVDVSFEQNADNVAGIVRVGSTSAYNDGTATPGKPGNGYFSCSNTYCHSPGTSVATGNVAHNANTTVTWGTAGSLACNSCHSGGTATGPTYVSGSPKTNSHSKHVVTNSYACNACHATVVNSSNTIISTSLHVNQAYEVSGARITSYTFATDGGTCSTACHGSATPKWGTTTNCASCHSANNTLAGVHSKHYGTATVATNSNDSRTASGTAYIYNCGVCHNAAPHATGDVSSIQAANVSFGANHAISGTYTADTVLAGTDNGFKWTNGTCTTLYCHSQGTTTTSPFGGAPNTTARWNGSALTCSGCHNYNVASGLPMATGNHSKHVNNVGVLGTNYVCQDCHTNTTSDGTTITNEDLHVNKVKDVSMVKGGTWASPNCTNVYCHSDGQPVATRIYATVPAWNSSTNLGCNGCHGTGNSIGRPDYANGGAGTATANSHTAHATVAVDCANCHADTTSNGTAITSGSTLHTNAAEDVSIASAYDNNGSTSNWNSGTKTCSSITCHGAGAPVWGGPALACDQCHLASNLLAGAHSKHYGTATIATSRADSRAASGTAYIYNCGVCHDATSHGTGSVSANQAAEVNFGVNHAISGSYAPGALAGTDTGGYKWTNGTCSTLYCHSQGTSTTSPFGGAGNTAATWNGTAMSCEGCHNFNAAATNKMSTGRHTAHINDGTIMPNIACSACHVSTTSDSVTIANEDLHVNKVRDVNIAATWDSNGTPGDNWASSQCSNVYCHSTGEASPTYRTILWSASITDCKSCHNYDVASGLPMTSGSHTEHINNAGVLGTNYGCQECHTSTTSNGTSITTPANHINKVRDVSIVKGGTWASPNCTTTYCHSSGKGTYQNPPSWGTATNLGCNGCHGTSTTAGAPDYASGAAGTANANSHSKHTGGGTSSGTCYLCHNTTVAASGTAIKAGSALHTNGSFDLSPGGGRTFTWVGGVGNKNCSNISCHYNGSAQWGATLNCSACHGALSGAHNTHIGDLISGSGAAYGSDSNTSTASAYRFNCGNCHPLDIAKHADGALDVELYNAAAAGFKANNPSSAALNGVIGTSVTTCDNVYCHSNGMASRTYYTTPQWGQTYTAGACNGCHGNWPSVTKTGSSAHVAHAVGIHFDDVYNNGTGKLPSSAASGTNAGHGTSTASTTINCNICHADTVTVSYNALGSTGVAGSTCSTGGCHTTGGSGTIGNAVMVIADKSHHVNAIREVSFANVTIRSKSQVRDDITTVTDLNTYWARQSGYKGGSSSHDASKSALRTAASFAAGSCSAVVCHNGNSVNWSDGAITCDKCHTGLPQ